MSNTFAALEQEMLDCYFTRRPLAAAQLGLDRARGLLPPVSTGEVDRLIDRYRILRSRISRVPWSRLAAPELLTVRLMDQICGDEIASLSLYADRYCVSPLPEAGLASALLTFLPYASVTSDVTDTSAAGYLAACAAIPQALADYTEELSAGRGAGRSPVRRLVDRSTAQLRTYLAGPIEQDVLLAPLSGAGPEPDRSRLTRMIEQQIRPAFARLADEFDGPVRDTARADDRAGICWLPNGAADYRVLIREHTTLDLDPKQLHELGVDRIERLEAEAVAIARRLGWAGDFAAVRDRLRNDPALRFADGAQMLTAAASAMNRAAARVPEWITDLPAARCEVRPMAATETDHGVIGHYETAPLDRSGPAVYWLNTAEPADRTMFEAEALAFHESVPGHHIEIATSQEAISGSEFRRLVQIMPYTEGWALYAERLADEMGLYGSDLDRLGMVSFDLWRSCRLVVDTGLHELGWSRSRAVDYLWEHSILGRGNVVNEVDRYLAHPGSALAYMVGRLTIAQLREAVGAVDREQLRAFHDRLLRRGPLTLGLLAEQAGVRLAFPSSG